MATIALSVICKGNEELENLERMLGSLPDEIDHIYITCNHKYDKIKELEKKYPNLSVDYLEWKDDFSEQRNHNVSLIKEDVYIWLDCDDTFKGDKGVLSKLASYIVSTGIAGFIANYDYSPGLAGYKAGDHDKLRVINNRLGLKWEKTLHENIDYKGYDVEITREIEVFHHFDEEKRLEKTKRNYQILMAEVEGKNTEEIDPRTIGYIGRTAFTYSVLMREEDKALSRKLLLQSIQAFELFKKVSGWDEEIYFCLIQLADCYHVIGDEEKEETNLLEAVRLFPAWCDAYCKLCVMENLRGNWARSCDWGKIALNATPPSTVLGNNEELRIFLSPLSFVDSLIHLGRYDLAAQVLVKMDRENPMVQDYAEIVKEMAEDVAYQDKSADFLKELAKKAPDKASKVVSLLPGDLLQSVKIAGLARSLVEKSNHGSDSVVIFCGMGIGEDWADPAVITGIGGSEEAVIYLSRELVKLGKKVTVYNSCGEQSGNYQGVEYKPWSLFNPEDTFDTLIMWRNPQAASHKFDAKNVWIWLHDVTQDNDIPVDLADNVKFIFLSQYHRSLAPVVPEERVIYSSNGLTISKKEVEKLFSKIERNQYKIVYASSYDRGLEHLLMYWPTIKENVPEAELHIAYGWGTFDKLRKDRESLAWKAKMDDLMNQEGIVHHGKLGAKQLKELLASSNIWCYPCHFEEISCITAMRAQALGAYPVCTDYAALSETVQHGTKIKVENFNDPLAWSEFFFTLISKMKEPVGDRLEMSTKSLETFSWEGVAKQWVNLM